MLAFQPFVQCLFTFFSTFTFFLFHFFLFSLSISLFFYFKILKIVYIKLKLKPPVSTFTKLAAEYKFAAVH